MRYFVSKDTWRMYCFRWATFLILEAWKSDSCRVIISFRPAKLAWFQHCSTFCQNDNVILQGLRYPSIKGIFVKSRYFSAFLRPENAIPQVSWDSWVKLDILIPWKCHFGRVVRSWAQGYMASSDKPYSILATGKCDYSGVI